MVSLVFNYMRSSALTVMSLLPILECSYGSTVLMAIKWTQPRGPSAVEWIRMMWCICSSSFIQS